MLRRFTWPDAARLRAYGCFLGVFSLLFFPVYAAGGYLGAASGRAAVLAFGWEAGTPLIPWMIAPYFSLFTSFLLPLFHMTPGEMRVLSRQSVFCILAAGLVFAVFPTRSDWPPADAGGLFGPGFDLIAMADTRHNLFPSLHVAFGALLLIACAARAPIMLSAFYWLWLALMAASTLFVHQHYVADVAAGLLLASAARRLFRFPPGGARARA